MTPSKDQSRSKGHLVVVGLMGVGKSTTGETLAARLGWEYVDSDTDVERLTGQTGRDYAVSHGVPALHELEAAVLLGALARSGPSVITAAASTVEREVVRTALGQRAAVVRLVLPVDEALKRQAEGGHRRPMARDELVAIAERREPLFVIVEDLKLTADRPPDQLVDSILAAFPGLG